MDEQNYKLMLGRNIKRIRDRLGLTQESFCNSINLEISNLSNIENGKTFPSPKTMLKIINIFKVEPNDLFDSTFYNSEEAVNKLFFEFYNKLSLQRKITALKMLIIFCEENSI